MPARTPIVNRNKSIALNEYTYNTDIINDNYFIDVCAPLAAPAAEAGRMLRRLQLLQRLWRLLQRLPQGKPARRGKGKIG